jgi:hypothetical protein
METARLSLVDSGRWFQAVATDHLVRGEVQSVLEGIMLELFLTVGVEACGGGNALELSSTPSRT